MGKSKKQQQAEFAARQAQVEKVRAELAWKTWREACEFYRSAQYGSAQTELSREVWMLAEEAMDNAYDTHGRDNETTQEFALCLLASMECLLSVEDQESELVKWYAAWGVRA